MKFLSRSILFLMLSLLISATAGQAQSRRNAKPNDDGGVIMNVIASRDNGSADPIRVENLYLYENGIEQKIKNFSYDPSPSRILVLVDNSQTFAPEVEDLKKAVMEFAYEIFEGDELYVIAYDEKPEIIQEWSDDAKKIEAALATFRKKGNPYLFSAIDAAVNEVLVPLMPSTQKTAIVLISDGLDRGSSKSFENTLSLLQNQNVTLYALQLADRTGGAYRRNQPKAREVIKELTEGTGGLIFPFEDASKAAKFICDEMRKNRYLLSYSPRDFSSYDARRVLLVADEGIKTRIKAAQPPNLKP